MVVGQSANAAKVPTTLVIQSKERPAAVKLKSLEKPSSLKIAFSVSYKRLEYLSFVTPHLTATLIKTGKLGIGKPLPLYARYLLTVMGSIGFFLKKRKMPVCHFEINDTRICRRTALGLLVLPWSEVVAVHRYAPGLLVFKKNGAMPLPFRCLTRSQIDTLESFVETWRAEHCQTVSSTA